MKTVFGIVMIAIGLLMSYSGYTKSESTVYQVFVTKVTTDVGQQRPYVLCGFRAIGCFGWYTFIPRVLWSIRGGRLYLILLGIF